MIFEQILSTVPSSLSEISQLQKTLQSLKILPVAFLSVFKYSCRFGRLHRFCLSIVDCFWFLHLVFPSIAIREISLKQSEISDLYSFDSYYFYTSIFNPSTEKLIHRILMFCSFWKLNTWRQRLCHSVSTWQRIVSARFSILSRSNCDCKTLTRFSKFNGLSLQKKPLCSYTNLKESACNKNVILCSKRVSI